MMSKYLLAVVALYLATPIFAQAPDFTKATRSLITVRPRAQVIEFSPDSQFLAAGTNRAIHIWDTNTGQEKPALTDYRDWITCMAISPDSKLIAGGGDKKDGSVKVWEIGTGKLVQTITPPAPATGLIFSPDGKTLFISASDKSVTSWNVTTGKDVRIYEGAQYPMYAFAFLDGGKFLRAAGGELKGQSNVIQNGVRNYFGAGQCITWGVEAGQIVQELTPANGSSNCALSTDGQRLACYGPMPGNPGGTFGDILAAYQVPPVDGGDLRRLWSRGGEIFNLKRPTVIWTPTGDYALFGHSLFGSTVITLPGLADGGERDYAPLDVAISPNGKFYVTATVSGLLVRAVQ